MKRFCCYPGCKAVLTKPLSECYETHWEALSINGKKAASICPDCKKKPHWEKILRIAAENNAKYDRKPFAENKGM